MNKWLKRGAEQVCVFVAYKHIADVAICVYLVQIHIITGCMRCSGRRDYANIPRSMLGIQTPSTHISGSPNGPTGAETNADGSRWGRPSGIATNGHSASEAPHHTAAHIHRSAKFDVHTHEQSHS